GCSATLRNTRSKLGLGVSAPTSRAMSMKRFDCAGSSAGGFGLRGMDAAYTRADHSSNSGNSSWRGSWFVRNRLRLWRALERRRERPSDTRRRIGKTFAFCADEDAIGAGQIIDAKRDPVVVTEIEFGR